MSSTNQIKCPKCATIIDVNGILTQQLEQQIRQKYQAEALSQRKEVEAMEQHLITEKLAFEEKKKHENELFNERLTLKISEEKIIIQEKEKLKAIAENALAMESMKKELEEQSEKVKLFAVAKVEIEKLKREKDEAKSNAEADAQKRLTLQLQEEAEKIKKATAESFELKFRELAKQLEDQKKLTEEMSRKQSQGSMQLQGEVQELAIEEWLSAKFPLDTIEEIGKGVRGGDCIQRVHTRSQQNCGAIYYESKRTKEFQPAWIQKLKADMRDKNVSVGVIVTEAMPKDMGRMDLREGIWICNYEDFKSLSIILREGVINLNTAQSSQENKGDKMELLYGFLTSNTFRMQVEAIVEGFSQMKVDLDSEKRSMQRIWKQREKQLEKVIENTIDMHASIRGIAGNAIQAVKALELGSGEDITLED
jgi:hypothetical protein